MDPTLGKVAGLGQASWCVETLSIKFALDPALIIWISKLLESYREAEGGGPALGKAGDLGVELRQMAALSIGVPSKVVPSKAGSRSIGEPCCCYCSH